MLKSNEKQLILVLKKDKKKPRKITHSCFEERQKETMQNNSFLFYRKIKRTPNFLLANFQQLHSRI